MGEEAKIAIGIGLAFVSIIFLIGQFVTTYEVSKHRMLTECLKLGKSALECKLLERN